VIMTRNDTHVVFDGGEALEFELTGAHFRQDDPASDGVLLAPMPGRIVAISTRDGDRIAKGQPIMVLEAMKMEHVLTAPFDALVALESLSPGDQVSEGRVLARLMPVDP
jgi:propionyl-CoA carboxylase alpha chain/3-methylcrotonyl-CoA carboxylase alpha subunit